MNAIAQVQETREAMKWLGSGAWAGVPGAEWREEGGKNAGRCGADEQAEAEDVSSWAAGLDVKCGVKTWQTR